MSALKTAVLRQIAYAKSVRSVIRSIMRRMLDGEWINHIFASSDDEFNDKLDEAFKSLDFASATKGDYCKVVAEVLCDEVSRLCLVLKDVCDGSGYGDYFDSHISHERFVRLVLSTDTVKLGRMKRILEDASQTPIDVLRGIGAVLNDTSSLEERTALGARERRIANAELKTLVEETKNAIDKVGAKVEAVDRKVSSLRRGGKPRGRYTQKAKAICWSCWTSAANHEEIWRSVNTRITYKAVFDYYHARLVQVGVNDHNAFRDVIHAEVMRRNRELAMKQGKARQKTAAQPNTKRGKNGIIRGMKKNARTALLAALAIVGGMASPLRSDASEHFGEASAQCVSCSVMTDKEMIS